MNFTILRFLKWHNCNLGFHKWNEGTCDFCGSVRTTRSLRKLKRIALDFRDPDAFISAIGSLAGYKCTRSESWGFYTMRKGKHCVALNIGRDMLARHDLIYSLVYENKAKAIRFVLIENGEFTYS
jgi:hypothetical protein